MPPAQQATAVELGTSEITIRVHRGRSCGKCKRTRWQNWSGWQTGSGFG